MVDTRATLRYPIDLAARVVVGSTRLSARIRNVSLGGVYLAGPTLPIGTRCTLHYNAPHVGAVEVGCITRWTTGDGCGLMFDPLRPMDTHQLAQFIRDARRANERLPTDAILRR